MLLKKQKIDKTELENYNEELYRAKLTEGIWQQTFQQLNSKEKDLREKIEYEQHKLDECKKDLQTALDTYSDITETRLKEIDTVMEEQRQKRQADLDSELQAKTKLIEKIKIDTQHEIDSIHEQCANEISQAVKQTEEEKTILKSEIEYWEERWLSILSSVKRIEQSKQEKLFYTIQLPEEYQEDIEFLLTAVAARVQHPDIISKLVWAEYVKPNLDETFKRLEIKPEAGIYKLTSLINGKCYIGKSTNVKNRIGDHFKSVVGVKSIADQAVHHAILKEGFWNWRIEVITYCDKDKLNELEKYYIEFFKAQEFGYNKTGGG